MDLDDITFYGGLAAWGTAAVLVVYGVGALGVGVIGGIVSPSTSEGRDVSAARATFPGCEVLVVGQEDGVDITVKDNNGNLFEIKTGGGLGIDNWLGPIGPFQLESHVEYVNGEEGVVDVEGVVCSDDEPTGVAATFSPLSEQTVFNNGGFSVVERPVVTGAIVAVKAQPV